MQLVLNDSRLRIRDVDRVFRRLQLRQFSRLPIGKGGAGRLLFFFRQTIKRPLSRGGGIGLHPCDRRTKPSSGVPIRLSRVREALAKANFGIRLLIARHELRKEIIATRLLDRRRRGLTNIDEPARRITHRIERGHVVSHSASPPSSSSDVRS